MRRITRDRKKQLKTYKTVYVAKTDSMRDSHFSLAKS